MYEPYNPYNNAYVNPYLNYSQQLQQMPRQNQVVYKSQNSLQGKVVDSLDVVKATDIPYDGSVSYFPLTDGTAIITKQLQQDGTSKVVIYKPMIENEESMKALEETMQLFTEFAQKMIQEVDSPEAKQIIRKHLRKISQMG